LCFCPATPAAPRAIAGLFDGGLEKSRLVNQHRSLLGYTGTYHGKPVSVQTSGIGTPSFSS
jgi:purine-nucleoside phosphorylase